MVVAVIQTIFAQPTGEAVRTQLDTVADQLEGAYPKVAGMLRAAKDDLTAFAAFPKRHWKQIWTTNLAERTNREIKRRSDVVGVFPNPAAIVRLVGAVLMETGDEWIASGKRYMSKESMQLIGSNEPKLEGGIVTGSALV